MTGEWGWGPRDSTLYRLTSIHARLMGKLDEVQEISQERAQRIREAHDAGHSWATIAQALGVTRSAVSRFAKP